MQFTTVGRILAIDFGRKRCGVAVTDPLQIVAGGLSTVATSEILTFVKKYVSEEVVDLLVVGEPHQMNGDESETMNYIRPFLGNLHKALPALNVVMVDERFTTKIAQRAIIQGGVSKKDRNNKSGLVDMVSAQIILETYLDMKNSGTLSIVTSY